MNTVTKLTFLIIALLLTATQVEAGGKKKEKLLWEPPAFDQMADIYYHPGRDRYYITDAGYFNPYPQSLEQKKEKLQDFNEDDDWEGRIFEVHPLDYENRIVLPNIKAYAPVGIIGIGDSLYIGDERHIIGYDLTTSNTFTSVWLDSLGEITLMDCVKDSNDMIYFSARLWDSTLGEIFDYLYKFDYRTETVEKMNLPDEDINDILGLYYDETENRILFVTYSFDSSAIKSISLSSSSVTTLRQTGYSSFEAIVRDSVGNYIVSGSMSRMDDFEIYRFSPDFSEELSKIPFFDIETYGIVNMLYEARNNNLVVLGFKRIQEIRLLYNPPEIIHPPQNATDVGTNVAFQWQLFDSYEFGPLYYTFQLSMDNNFDSLIVDSTIEDSYMNREKFYFKDDLELNTTYYWRVKVDLNSQSTGWSESHTFTTTDSLRPVPLLVSPVQNAVISGNTVTFSWSEIPGATNYLICIESASYTNDYFYYETSNNSVTLTDYFPNDMSRLWKVKASKGLGESSWSEQRIFSIEPYYIQNPYPLYPDTDQDGIETEVEIRWKEVDEANYYVVKLYSNENDYTEIILDSTSLFLDNLEYRTWYIWTVIARNDTAKSYEKLSYFRTAYEPINPPGLIAPVEDGGLVRKNPKLLWQNTGAEYYQVHVSEVGDEKPSGVLLLQGESIPWFLNNPTIVVKEQKDTVYQIAEQLKDKTYYSWRVQAYHNGSNSKWSDIKYFKTDFSTAVEDEKNDNNFINIYPNPASSKTNVEFYTSVQSEINIDIYNLMGTNVRTYSLGLLGHGYHNFDINLEDLPDGIYYMVMKNASKNTVQKLILMR